MDCLIFFRFTRRTGCWNQFLWKSSTEPIAATNSFEDVFHFRIEFLFFIFMQVFLPLYCSFLLPKYQTELQTSSMAILTVDKLSYSFS